METAGEQVSSWYGVVMFSPKASFCHGHDHDHGKQDTKNQGHARPAVLPFV